MDDTNQVPNPKSQIPSSGGNGDQSTQPQSGTVVQFPQGVSQQDSGTLAKEQEPLPSKPLVHEFLTPSEQPVEIEKDLEEAGIQDTAKAPQLAEEIQKAGVSHTGTATPLPQAPKAPSLRLPIDPEKAEKLTKGSFLFKNPSSSLLWLALVVL